MKRSAPALDLACEGDHCQEHSVLPDVCLASALGNVT